MGHPGFCEEFGYFFFGGVGGVDEGGVVGGGGELFEEGVNSSSVKRSRQAALSTGWVRMASRVYSMGTPVWMVTNSFERRMLSRLFWRDSR